MSLFPKKLRSQSSTEPHMIFSEFFFACHSPPDPGGEWRLMVGQYRPVCNSATDCVCKMSPSHWERYHAGKKPIWTFIYYQDILSASSAVQPLRWQLAAWYHIHCENPFSSPSYIWPVLDSIRHPCPSTHVSALLIISIVISNKFRSSMFDTKVNSALEYHKRVLLCTL